MRFGLLLFLAFDIPHEKLDFAKRRKVAHYHKPQHWRNLTIFISEISAQMVTITNFLRCGSGRVKKLGKSALKVTQQTVTLS